MKLEKKHWMIIAVVIALIVVWYFFFKKKKVAESGFVKKSRVIGTPADTRACPIGCKASSVSGPSGTTMGCYCPGAGWQ